MKAIKSKGISKGKKFFNQRDKVKLLNLSFEAIRNISETHIKKEIILPSIITKEKLDEDIELLKRL
jgi:hypothetical protein